MGRITARKTILSLVLFTAVCGAVYFISSPDASQSGNLRWYSIVPPLLAIFLAFLTHHVVLSLGIAIVVGGLLCEVPAAPLEPGVWLDGFENVAGIFAATATDRTNLVILSFIPAVFVTIQLVIRSGGFQGILLWLARWIKGRRSAQGATALMGIICFIDDYANAMIVGSMMQPITDRHRVSRQKLAFIVDATSAPIAGLAVISTWIAYEVGLLGDIAEELAIDKNGYAMFFDALAYRFYCWLMIAFVFAHITLGRDFGPMRKAEEPNGSGGDKNEERSDAPKGSPPGDEVGRPMAICAILPLGALLVVHLTGLWFDGDGLGVLREGGSLVSLTYWREVIGAAENSSVMLARAGVVGVVIALLCSTLVASLGPSDIGRCIIKGLRRASIPVVILILAWSLKNCCGELGTGKFLTSLLAGRVSPWLFAPMVFVVASIVSFATGTSYGTMAILLPTAVPVAFALDGDAYGLCTVMSIGAVLDGAIFGDHCSPISDTTIMSSISTSCDLMDHVQTQLPYSLFVAAVALLLAYLPSALGLWPGASLGLGVVAIIAVLALAIRRTRWSAG